MGMSNDGRRYVFQYEGGVAEAQDTSVKERS